ncbi:MAG: membrane associated rhomboid family serine protease [Gammaproteobacteria bacterium]|jgi:membrane associated rhomboid family serine protease
MLILPYSTALRIAHPPIVSYAVTVICVLVFMLQLKFPITASLWYEPASWNPIHMITASFAHGGWLHLVGNLVFFLAFAPALEALIGNKKHYLWLMLFVSIVVGISYSVSILIGASEPLPTLGLSGVVMGMIGLSAFLMPKAKIRVIWWYIVFWKIFYVPAWIVAAVYIGLDSWKIFSADDYHGVNLVAHVGGGIAGYVFGFLWLKERKEETQEELADEIEAMKVEQKYGGSRALSFRSKKVLDLQQSEKQQALDFDKFMGTIYQCVKTHRDAEAINLLLTKFDESTPVVEVEALFKRAQEWGPSRTLLCIGRLIIHKLDEEKRFGRSLVFIEKCQAISPKFVLADLSKTLFYARFAMETEKPELVRNLLVDHEQRFGNLVNMDQCQQILQQVLRTDIDIIL